MSTPKKPTPPSNGATNTIVALYPNDYECIEAIKKAHGLMRVSDCVRFALRETVRQIENSKQPA
jgi:hypothetical protein